MLVLKLGGIHHIPLWKMWKLGYSWWWGKKGFRPRCTEAVDCIQPLRFLLGWAEVCFPSHYHPLSGPWWCRAWCWLSIINMSHICLVYRCVCRTPSAFPGDPVTNRGRKKIGTRRTSWSSFGTVTAKCIQLGSWSTESLVIAAWSNCLWATVYGRWTNGLTQENTWCLQRSASDFTSLGLPWCSRPSVNNHRLSDLMVLSPIPILQLVHVPRSA